MSTEIKDLAGLSKPISKLIEVVSTAIGTHFQPKTIKAQADAKAYEILAIAKAEAEAAVLKQNIELIGTIDRIASLSQEQPELVSRAKNRLLAREIEGQLNVEAIANEAIARLPEHVSEEPISQDWRRKFFLEAENVCESDMQTIWAKVLAGELAAPGRFSLRTLDALRHISKPEAELFRIACSLAMQDGWIALPGGNINQSLKLYGLGFSEIMILRDAGLIHEGDHIHKTFQSNHPVAEPQKQLIHLVNNGIIIELLGAATMHLQVPALIFSRVGRELQGLIENSENPDYLKALGSNLRRPNLSVKRGTPMPHGEGASIITFEQDL